MSESNTVTIALALIGQLAAIITPISVIVLGYWAYKAKQEAKRAAAVVTAAAETVAVKMDATVQTIEATAAGVAKVQDQTDGHLTKMETLLSEKTQELKEQTQELREKAAELQEETAKVARLTGALHEARGSPSRREDDPK